MLPKSEENDHGFPRKKDRFFRTSDIGRNTVLALNKAQRRRNVITGYREAAELLAAKVEEGRGFDDNLVFPLIFSYRHVFEISMKEIIDVGGWREGITLTKSEKNHQLLPLWRKTKQVLSSMDLMNWGVDDSTIDRLMNEFDGIDLHSFSFRYHTDKSDELINMHRDYVDLVIFIETARRLTAYFERVTYELDDRVQYILNELAKEKQT
ncbi:hypothetical protein Brsp07_01894 [Brucella sp. NBRC 14130]|uniref:hypothetical protein n=1 Tax=Brucella sp. NBRC 14130 TaxID=3075483 RepID=UPI0030B6F82F